MKTKQEIRNIVQKKYQHPLMYIGKTDVFIKNGGRTPNKANSPYFEEFLGKPGSMDYLKKIFSENPSEYLYNDIYEYIRAMTYKELIKFLDIAIELNDKRLVVNIIYNSSIRFYEPMMNWIFKTKDNNIAGAILISYYEECKRNIRQKDVENIKKYLNFLINSYVESDNRNSIYHILYLYIGGMENIPKEIITEIIDKIPFLDFYGAILENFHGEFSYSDFQKMIKFVINNKHFPQLTDIVKRIDLPKELYKHILTSILNSSAIFPGVVRSILSKFSQKEDLSNEDKDLIQKITTKYNIK